jgi:chemotaxis response regulator CheB
MPREAIAIGAANYIEHLNNIAERITLATKENSLKKAS